jgi:hypothetical protein
VESIWRIYHHWKYFVVGIAEADGPPPDTPKKIADEESALLGAQAEDGDRVTNSELPSTTLNGNPNLS